MVHGASSSNTLQSGIEKNIGEIQWAKTGEYVWIYTVQISSGHQNKSVHVCAACWAHFMWPYELWPTLVSHLKTSERFCSFRLAFLTLGVILLLSQVTPGNWGTYCFWSVSATVSAAAVLPTLFNFLGKPLKLISSNHLWLTYGCGKISWHPSRWPWVKVNKLPKWDRFYLVPKIKWEQLLQLLQNLVGISP